MFAWIWVPVSILCVWGAVCALLARLGGWFALAQRFPGREKPQGIRFGHQSAGFGWVDYNGCLTIHVDQVGLWITIWPLFRFAHPPLLLPWGELHVTEVHSSGWRPTVKLAVGDPAVARVRLALKVVETARQFLPTDRVNSELEKG
jgi:hypothetical protein